MQRTLIPIFLLCPALATPFLVPESAAADLAEIERQADRLVRFMVFLVEIAGISIIILGVAVSTFFFLADLIGRRDPVLGYHDFRTKLGRAILLGLEFLVAADIINTVAIHPSLQNLGTLAIIISIRVFLSFALEVEIEGTWPWQRGSRP